MTTGLAPSPVTQRALPIRGWWRYDTRWYNGYHALFFPLQLRYKSRSRYCGGRVICSFFQLIVREQRTVLRRRLVSS